MIRGVLSNALMIQSGVQNVVLQDNTITQGRIWVINNQGLETRGQRSRITFRRHS